MKLQNNYPIMDVIRGAEEFRTPKNLLLKCLIFAVVFFFMAMAESIGTVAGVIPGLMDWAREYMAAHDGQLDSMLMTEKINEMLLDPSNTNIMLYCTGFGTLVVFFFCRVVEGRKLRTMGFKAKGGLVQYLIGLISGFVMFSMVVGIAYLCGGLTWNGFKGCTVPALLIVLLGFGIQGMSEEVLCRGCFMTSILRDHNVFWAVALNSIAFGLLHGGNDGFSLLAFINLILYAVMISLYVLRTDNLWGACAVHSIWNFAQGNFYGLPVSGIDAGETVFSMSLSGSDLVNGGAFGLEAGIATTIVMTLSILVLLFVPLPFAVNGHVLRQKDNPAAPSEDAGE